MATFSKDLAKADRLYADEAYEEALEVYSSYLQSSPDDAEGLASRAAAYIKLNRHKEALQDANNAARIRPDYEIAYHRKGLAAFSLGEYETAKQAFEKGQQLFEATGKPDHTRKYKTWIRKCDAEIEEEEVMPKKQNGAVASHGSSASAGSTSLPTAVHPQAPTPSSSAPPAMPQNMGVRYQYYQTNTHMIVTVLQKNLKPEDANIVIEPRRLTLALKKDGGEVVVLDKSLFDEVDVKESSPKFFSTKVEIRLKKQSAFQWADLEGTGEKTIVAAPAVAAAPTSQPEIPRPYAGKKDWNKVEKEIEKEEDDPQGEEALQKLFKDIYAKGSDETRRAMIKSFQTSGGTVLSTNWNEVAQKDYEKERQAPDGMEWRTYEGDKVGVEDEK